MRVLMLAAVAVLALSACRERGGTGSDGPRSMEDVARESAGMPRPEPGLYRSQVELLSVEAPGMPPQMADQMKQAMAGKAAGNSFCLTAEEAGKGYEERVKKLASRPDCAFDRYSAEGGKLDAQLTCKGEGGMRAVMTMQGTMTPAGSDVTLGMDQSGGQMPGGGMKMKMRVKSERVGDCKA